MQVPLLRDFSFEWLLLKPSMYKFAIIGCGHIAPRHAENIVAMALLSAVCDIIPKKADAFAQKYGAKAYYSIDDLLLQEDDIDVVTVCTPNGLHAEHSIKSLQAGKHVLCEKPMCITGAAAWQMIETAYFFRKKLFIVKQNRFNPGVVLLKDLVKNDCLGNISSFAINCFWNRPQEYYTGEWKGSKVLDGGILYTQFSHFVDLLYWILGDVKDVNAFSSDYQKRKHFEVEDTLVAVLKMNNDVIGTFNCTINSYRQNIEGSITIFGEKGSIKIGGQYLNKIEWFEVESKTQPKEVETNSSNNYGYYEGSMSNHHLVYEELIKALNDRDNNMVEAIEAVKTIEIIEKIYKAVDQT
jgi:predicted dehydrogenase